MRAISTYLLRTQPDKAIVIWCNDKTAMRQHLLKMHINTDNIRLCSGKKVSGVVDIIITMEDISNVVYPINVLLVHLEPEQRMDVMSYIDSDSPQRFWNGVDMDAYEYEDTTIQRKRGIDEFPSTPFTEWFKSG